MTTSDLENRINFPVILLKPSNCVVVPRNCSNLYQNSIKVIIF